MNNSGEIVWKGKVVGEAAIITVDMWYVDANWKPYQSENSMEFGHVASKIIADEVIKNPVKGTIIELKYFDRSPISEKFLVLGLEGEKLYMRMISDEIADWVDHKHPEPWQETDNPFL